MPRNPIEPLFPPVPDTDDSEALVEYLWCIKDTYVGATITLTDPGWLKGISTKGALWDRLVEVRAAFQTLQAEAKRRLGIPVGPLVGR